MDVVSCCVRVPIFIRMTINKPQIKVTSYNIMALTLASLLVCKSGQPAVPEVLCATILTTQNKRSTATGQSRVPPLTTAFVLWLTCSKYSTMVLVHSVIG